MTDATLSGGTVRLRARFESGQALVEHLRRRPATGGVEPTGTYRAVWPHHLQIPGADIVAIKALVASLPLLRLAGDPDEAEAFPALTPRRDPMPGGATAPHSHAPHGGAFPTSDAPTGQGLPPKAGVRVRGDGRARSPDQRRGYLAAHFSTREDA